MSDIPLSDDENSEFRKIMRRVNTWCKENQWAIGIGEMAAGAGLIYAGVNLGHIRLGTDILGVETGGFSPGALASGGIDGGTGALAGAILGNIGVVALGGGIGIPAWVLALGGAAVFGAAGYGVGDAVHHFLNPPINIGDVFAGGSIAAIGLALLIDGARRLITDDSVKRLASSFCNGVIHLVKMSAEVVANSRESLRSFLASLVIICDPLPPMPPVGPTTGVASAGVGAVAGGSIGGGIAAGSVTVLGSHALGGVALSLGLVSAPILPVVACALGGAALGLGIWYGVRRLFS